MEQELSTADAIKDLRMTLGMTQHELAMALGLAHGDVVRFYECGVRTPSIKTARRIMALAEEHGYEIDMAWLYPK